MSAQYCQDCCSPGSRVRTHKRSLTHIYGAKDTRLARHRHVYGTVR